jgi:hypothetical protein
MLETNKDDKRHEIQQLDKIGSTWGYNAGFFLGATTVGLLAGLVLGAIAILKYSKNGSIKNQTAAVNKRIQHNKISLKDLEKLSVGDRIPDRECTRIAIFIDGLEQKLGSLKDGQQVGDRYVFTKTIDPNGVINYTVTDVKSKQIAASFDLDRNGKLVVQSRDKFEAIVKLDEFASENADKISVNINEDISLYSGEVIQAGIVEQEVQLVKTSSESFDKIDLVRLATASESAQSQYIESLNELNHQLSELKARAKTIADQIHSAEVANDKESHRHPENTLLGIKVSCLVDKLVGLDKQIDELQSNLQGKPQTIDEVKAYQQDARVDSTAPSSEIDALKQEISQLRGQLKVLTSPPPLSDRPQSKFAPPPLSKDTKQSRVAPPPPPLPQDLKQSELATRLEHGNFSEEGEYPNLPADLSELQVAEYPDLDELLQVADSPANGQPITIVAAESPDYGESEGLEQ